MKTAELIGQRFGKLTVTEDSGQRSGASVLWRCTCDCGGEVLAKRYQLLSGNLTDCGYIPRQYASKKQAEDLTERRFGELTVLRRAENDKSGKVCWVCRCDCGNELDVCTGSLLHGLTRSCGCWNREQSGKMHDHMHYQDDTCVEILKRSCEETGRNKSGFRGLFLMKNGRYRASITFQGKHYTLGYYSSFAHAVQARLDAEEVLHMGYIKSFEQYEEKAKAAPEWAEGNPFYFNAVRVNGEFQVSTNGV